MAPGGLHELLAVEEVRAVGPDLVLWGFMNEMKRVEGEGKLLAKEDDDSLPGLRFVAEGGRYRVRTNLITSGRTAWAIYAGTLREAPVDDDELYLAERARGGVGLMITRPTLRMQSLISLVMCGITCTVRPR